MSFAAMALDGATTQFNESFATRMEEWRWRAEKAWTKQADKFLAAPASLALTAMATTSFGFVDVTKQAFSLAINMVLGHVVWTQAYKAGNKSAKMDVTAELTQPDPTTRRETLTFTYGGEFIGSVTRITGIAGKGMPLHMGLEIVTAPYDADDGKAQA